MARTVSSATVVLLVLAGRVPRSLIPDCFDRYNRNMRSESQSLALQCGEMAKPPFRATTPGGHRRAGLDDAALTAAAAVLDRWRGVGGAVTVVAIDGHGASGKSTIAAQLTGFVGAALVHTDDFFAPGAPEAHAGSMALDSYYNLARLQAEALRPLRDGYEAAFRAYDWDSGELSDELTHVGPASLVVLEGVCSSAPELGGLVDKTVYVQTPEPERLGRLRGRISPQEWDSRWLAAEKEYFSLVRPVESFDLVIRGSTAPPVPARGPGATRGAAPGRTRKAGPAMTAVRVMLDYVHPWPNAAGFYVARERGWYREAGLDVELHDA